MEAILMTTTDGHWRLERAHDRFAQVAKEPEVEEPQRQRHRPQGEGEQPLAPPASTVVESGVRSNNQEGGSSGSGSALAPPPAPTPLEQPPLGKRGLDQETEMTDATVERLGEPKSSSSSSSSESSTDTEMGLVDVCTILSENSKAEGSHRGGLITLNLTKWDFDKADCRNKCRKLVENSKPLLLIGSPIDSC